MSVTGEPVAPPRFDLVVVVTSLGGIPATSTLLAGLPEAFPVPVLVVHHSRSPVKDEQFAWLLQRRTRLPVRIAQTGRAPLAPGVTVVLGVKAALGRQMVLTVEEGGAEGNGDALMTTAADVLGPSLLGVVLTGRLRDGSEGARAIKRRGGRVLVQDPTTAAAADMPLNTIATGCVDFVLPVDRLAPALVTLTMAPGGADLLRVPPPPWARLHA